MRGNLTKHIRTVHEKRRPFACGVCGASFGLKSDLKRHDSAVHADKDKDKDKEKEKEKEKDKDKDKEKDKKEKGKGEDKD